MPPQQGSPPHTRGKAASEFPLNLSQGITPAHAGKRPPRCTSTTTMRDHPRTRGEKVSESIDCLCVVGSPPHTRGKERVDAPGHLSGGITPAHAGKSPQCRPKWCRRWDHPRTRGEKHIPEPLEAARPGSPPHTRGKVMSYTPAFSCTRITPAHAGKSVHTGNFCNPDGDHPRTRGEKGAGLNVWEPGVGSPPHTRGKARAAPSIIVRNGSTPAHAGKRLNGSRF